MQRDMKGPRAPESISTGRMRSGGASMDVPGGGGVAKPKMRLSGTAAEYADAMSGIGGAASTESK